MKASELIKELQEYVELYGDKYIEREETYGGRKDLIEIDRIKTYSYGGRVMEPDLFILY